MKRSLAFLATLFGLFLVWQGFGGIEAEARQPLNSPSFNPTAASSLVADYQFRDSLNSSVNNAPALTNLGSNSFDSATVDDSTRRVLSFEPNNGVSLVPTTGLVSGQSYSIVMLFSLTSTFGNYRLLDFKNGTSNMGLYCSFEGLDFRGVASSNNRVIKPNNFVQLVMTRSAEGDVTVYINGVRQFFFADTAGNATIGPNNTLRFFRDNTGDGEASAGVLARIRLYNAVLSGSEIASLDRLPNQQAGCPSFSGLAQNNGTPGTSFQLNGIGLSGVTAVRFPNNLSAPFTINDDTQINVTVPAGAVSGTLTLTKPNCGDVQTHAVFNVPSGSPPALVADYQFQNGLASAAGYPPALLNLGSNSSASVGVDNRTRRVLKFDQNNGVAAFSTAGVISNQSYTVVVLFSLNQTFGNYRLLDFKNGTNNNGLYCSFDGLDFRGKTGSSNRVITANNFVQLVMTRNTAGNVAVYVNGVSQFSFVDTNGDALLEGNTLRFFRDNDGDGEASAGYVARIRLYNTALSSNEIAALDRLPLGSVTTVSAASFDGATLASESIVAAFGSDLATSVQVAATVPLPTSLAGTTVKIKDGLGIERPAPLFFVAPTQVNYQIPFGVIPGVAMVTITSGNGAVSVGTLQMTQVAPSLFTANVSGQGVATGVVLRVKADGAQSFEPLARFDVQQNRFVAVPIDLGPSGDQVFLIIYGTGWRGRSSLSAVTTNLGGTSAEVLYAGAQGDFVGLDQVNLRVPGSMRGRGEVNLVLTVDGRSANSVMLNFK